MELDKFVRMAVDPSVYKKRCDYGDDILIRSPKVEIARADLLNHQAQLCAIHPEGAQQAKGRERLAIGFL
jgi:hypothetical protein